MRGCTRLPTGKRSALVGTLASGVEPDHVRVGFGLWFIVFAGPVILGVSSMMALETFKPKFWTKYATA